MTNPSGSLQQWVEAARNYMELESETLSPPSSPVEESNFLTQVKMKESAIASELTWKGERLLERKVQTYRITESWTRSKSLSGKSKQGKARISRRE